MKLSIYFSLAALFILPNLCFANDLEARVAELENKMLALETAVSEKLGKCSMVYKKHTFRLNQCDPGTFARSVTPVGVNVTQLECGYYQLTCTKD